MGNIIKSKQPKEDSYFKEVIDSLNTIRDNNKYLKNLYYFLNLAHNYFSEDKMARRRPQVIMLGTAIPEEIVYASGVNPMWVLGGSLGTMIWADSFVPRDTDAVSQSILGFLKNDRFNLASGATVVIPIINDSMRKIAFMLSKEKEANVITVDFPPDKYDATSKQKWISQMRRLSNQLCDISKTKLTKESLDNAVKMVNSARYECRRFINNCKDNEALVSSVIKMFVLNTYYFADDISEWTMQLKELNNELEFYIANWNIPMKLNPKVMLMGSPVYFPNYKIPFLLDSINLDISSYVSADSQKIYINSCIYDKNPGFDEYFEHVVLVNYYCDCSSAYVNNTTMFDYVMNRELENKVHGVIYHVLKGQIEYDFELNKYEDFFTSKGIPVFRLETDYKYHDLEQIRIRVEAFTEMLSQNIINASRIA